MTIGSSPTSLMFVMQIKIMYVYIVLEILTNVLHAYYLEAYSKMY